MINGYLSVYGNSGCHPLISVVIGVFNGGERLSQSISSILMQAGPSFEVIAVDDGSTDDSAEQLQDLAKQDSRVRLIRQSHQGLTAALIAGCAEARGDLIARQDVGDRSFPGRLARQVEVMDRHPEVVMTACGTQYLAPRGEVFSVIQQKGLDLQSGLELDIPRGVSHHGATMFRRSAYEAVGGYRRGFLVAQDVDLWVRLSEIGICWGDFQVGYEAEWAKGSISHRFREQQLFALETVRRCRELRRRGEDDREVVESFEKAVREARALAKKGMTRSEHAAYYYFVGSMLMQRDPAVALHYLRESVRHDPAHFRAWAKWGLAKWRGIKR